ncbi:NAD(P)-dependent alcohol dehydrogenase [Sporobolomyces koalae]|uniref:NAD(P)-dependent alcohol dehydrogenase n=1 Tax=Sporobolomyces koalae TaxID=500713 RepID=UPI00316D868E
MQAWVFRSKGKPAQVLALEQDYPRPVASGDLILVKVHAVSLNPVGWKTMGVAPLCWVQKTPCVPESDVSGTIVNGNLEGTDLKVGDAVFGIKAAELVLRSGQGVLAEYALVPKTALRRKPESLSFEQAAAVPLASLTVLSALLDGGKVRKDASGAMKVFINGGSGGVGLFAIQIALAYGCQVSTTCSSSSRSLVESVSSQVQLFDYTASPLHDQLRAHVSEDKKPFDVVFDTVGVPDLYHHSPAYLAKTGVYLDIAGPHLDGSFGSLVRSGTYLLSNLLRPSWLGGTPRKYKFVSMKVTGEHLDEIARLVTHTCNSIGSIKPILDGTFGFEDAKQAYERSMSGRAKGKVVIRVAA